MIYAVIAAFGIFVPWYRGIYFFDSFLVFAYSAIALLFAASAMANLMGSAGDPNSVTARIGASALHAWLVLLIILSLAVITVNLTFRPPTWLHPAWGLMAATAGFALGGSLLVSALVALLAILFTPAAARISIRVAFLSGLILLLYLPRFLAPAWRAAIERQLTTAGLTRVGWVGSSVALVLAVALIVTIRHGWNVKTDDTHS